MKKILLALRAIQSGMTVEAAAQKYGLSEAKLNDAIQRALLPNPLEFEGDTLKLSSNNNTETQTEKSFWDQAKDIAKSFINVLIPGKDVEGGKKIYEETNTATIDLSNASPELKARMYIHILE